MVMLEILKSIGLVTVPFAIYFGWMKIGHRVAASYTWRVSPLIASGIGTITLINWKDRPLAIFEIYAVMDNLCFTLKKFDAPLILKALEAVNVEADVVSNRYLGGEIYDWEPPPNRPADVSIFLLTSTRRIKCHRNSTPLLPIIARKHHLRLVVNETNTFNGLVYNDSAKYAITYTEEGKQKTAIIDISGNIYWDHLPNSLQPEHMRDIETVKAAIASCGLGSYISPFAVDNLGRKRRT